MNGVEERLREIARLLKELKEEGIAVDLTTADIEVGAVEIKNGTDDTRAVVNTSNELLVKETTTGTILTALSKTEDLAHSSGDKGIMSLGVRNDLGASLSNADGDYTPFATDEYGTLFVYDANLKSQLESISGSDYDPAFAQGFGILGKAVTSASYSPAYSNNQAVIPAFDKDSGRLLNSTKLEVGTAIIGKVSIDQVTANANEVVTKTGSTTVVSAITSSAATHKVDVGLVNGETIDVGAGTEAAAIRVTLPTDGTGKVGLNAGVALIGKVGIDQTTPGTTDKVSIISGQNGVAGNTGVVGATTQRVVLATDVALPAGTSILGKIGIDQTTPGTTNLVQTKETPDATATFCPSQDVSGTLESSSISKASAGVFYGLSGHNTLASAQWILVYNTTSVPANGAVTPIATIRVAANSNFSFDSGKFGIYCSTGICWSNSTDATIFNKTLGAADCFVNLSYS